MWLWLAFLALFAGQAPREQCDPPLRDALRRSTAVFSATVVGPEWIPEPYVPQFVDDTIRVDRWVEDQFTPGEPRIVRRKWVNVQVHRVWKGRVTERTRMMTGEVRYPRGGGEGPIDHEWTWADGESYLVYANGPADSLRTGICQRTRPLRDAGADVRALGRGRPPRRR